MRWNSQNNIIQCNICFCSRVICNHCLRTPRDGEETSIVSCSAQFASVFGVLLLFSFSHIRFVSVKLFIFPRWKFQLAKKLDTLDNKRTKMETIYKSNAYLVTI